MGDVADAFLKAYFPGKYISPYYRELLTKSGFVSEDSFKPVKSKHGYALRAAYRSIYPHASPDRVNQLAEFAIKNAGDVVNPSFDIYKTDQERLNGIRGLAFKEDPRSQKLRALGELYDNFYPSNDVPVPGANAMQNKLTLGNRTILPGEDTFQETKAESASDIAQSEMFSYKTDSDVGVSSLAIGNQFNKQLNLLNPAQPRPINNQYYPGMANYQWQWQQLPLKAVFEDETIRKVQEAVVRHMPINLLGDTQPETGNPFVKNWETAPFSVDTWGVQNVAQLGPVSSFENYLGFRPENIKYWRNPLQAVAIDRPVFCGYGGSNDAGNIMSVYY
jgi:hypothetical protein